MCLLPCNLLLCVVLFVLLSSTVSAVKVLGRNAVVTVGGNATLFCQLVETNEKLTRITWQKRSQKFPINNNFFAIAPDGKTEHSSGLDNRVTFTGNIQEINGTILLRNVTSSDEGTYTCIFNIFPSGPFKKEIQLNVLVPPVVSVTTDVIPVVGESEVILATCTAAKARPAPEVSWSLGDLSDSVKVETNVSVYTDEIYTVKSYLIGVASKELNQHMIQCAVNHTSLQKKLILDYAIVVHYPPQLVSIISVNVPTTTQEFRCVADANPPPTKFLWSRVNGTLLSVADGDRQIIKLNSHSNGLYICNASNQYGLGIGTLYIHISTESTTVCWSLFTSLLCIISAAFLIWKFNLIGRFIKLFSQLRERIWRSERAPVSTDPASPPENRGLNLPER